MIGNLAGVLDTLLKAALPAHLQGGPPPVSLSVVPQPFQVDSKSLDPSATEPAPGDQIDLFPFDAVHPDALHTLSKPPYPGPRRVALLTGAGDRIVLTPPEVVWDPVNSQEFHLALKPSRPVDIVTQVRVLYGVTGVSARLKAAVELQVVLDSADAVRLEEAESLVATVILLNRKGIADAAASQYDDGDYQAKVRIKDLLFVGGTPLSATRRALLFKADLEFTAGRALHDDEGMPIRRIASPGRPVDPQHPVDIRIDAEI